MDELILTFSKVSLCKVTKSPWTKHYNLHNESAFVFYDPISPKSRLILSAAVNWMSRKHRGVDCCAFNRKLVNLISESHVLTTSPLIIKIQETGEPISGKLMYIMLTYGWWASQEQI